MQPVPRGVTTPSTPPRAAKPPAAKPPAAAPAPSSIPGLDRARAWGNTISSWQFGIYRDPPPAESLASGRTSARASAGSAWGPRVGSGSGGGGARLRCCVAAAMAGVTALLVGVMVLDAAGARGAESRDKEVVRRLLLLQAAAAATAAPASFVAATLSNTSIAPNASTTTVTPAPAPDPPPLTATLPAPPTPAPAPVSGSTPEPALDPRLDSAPDPDLGALKAEDRSADDDSVAAQAEAQPFFMPAPKTERKEGNGKRRKQDRQPPPPPPPRPFLHPPPPPSPSRAPGDRHSQAAGTRAYAQLAPYRYPTGARNIQDIIKYLTGGGRAPPPPPGQHDGQPQQKGPGRYIAFPKHAIKFSGVYVNPRYEEPTAAAAGESDDRSQIRPRPPRPQPLQPQQPQPMQPQQPRPMQPQQPHPQQPQQKDDASTSLNGHAYITDPFLAFKPADPAEVNLLATDLRFAPSDRNTLPPPQPQPQPQPQPRPSDAYFPRPPIHFGPPADAGATTARPAAGTHTSAVYRPFSRDQSILAGAEASSGGGGVRGKKKPVRPFSVMLDIWPMAAEEQEAAAAGAGQGEWTVTRHQPHPNRRPAPLQHQYQQQPQHHQYQYQQPEEEKPQPHRMVVHLNLYPRAKSRSRANSRSDEELPSYRVSVRPGGSDPRKGVAGCEDAALEEADGSGRWADLLAELTGVEGAEGAGGFNAVLGNMPRGFSRAFHVPDETDEPDEPDDADGDGDRGAAERDKMEPSGTAFKSLAEARDHFFYQQEEQAEAGSEADSVTEPWGYSSGGSAPQDSPHQHSVPEVDYGDTQQAADDAGGRFQEEYRTNNLGDHTDGSGDAVETTNRGDGSASGHGPASFMPFFPVGYADEGYTSPANATSGTSFVVPSENVGYAPSR